MRARAEALGLRIALYQPFRDFEAVPAPVLDRNLRRAEAKFDVMEALGADTMLVCSSVSPDAIDDDDLAAAQLRALAERAAERGLRIAYEALAWGRHVNEYEHSWRIVAAADHPALGVCLDSFHILSRGSDPSGIRSIPGDKLFFLQLADAPRLRMDVLQWSRHYRCFPGQGAFDLAAFCGHVLAAGYDGPLSLEVFNDVFRRADPERTAVDAMRSLLVLEDELGLGPLPEPAGARRLRVRGARRRARTRRPAAEALLEALGFRHVGPHRSKPVQLWEQGDARVLLNHGDPHEEGIAALAVESADAARSVDRAEALRAPVLARRRQPGEADLAAVAAPDGTSVFFADRDREWLGDFVALDGARRAEAPASPASTTSRSPSRSTPSTRRSSSTARVLGLEPRESRTSPRPTASCAAAPSSTRRERCGSRSTFRCSAGAEDAAPQHVAFAHRRRARRRPRRCASAGSRRCRSPPTTTTTSRPGSTSTPGLLAELRALDVLYDRDARRRVPASLHARHRPRLLRGGRAAGRLRRLRRRQLPGPDGGAASAGGLPRLLAGEPGSLCSTIRALLPPNTEGEPWP